FSNLTSMPSNRGRRACAASREIANRSFNARSAGAFFGLGAKPASNCCVRSVAAYSRAQSEHCPTWCVSVRISDPLTRPSRYGENNFLISVHVMVSPQSLSCPANSGSCLPDVRQQFDLPRIDRREPATLTPNLLPEHIPPISCATRRVLG